MEQFVVNLNDPLAYDLAIAGCPSEGGDLELITKDNGMVSGAACALLTFSIEYPSGSGRLIKVQASTTVKLLKMALAALHGRYDDDGWKRPEVPG